MNAMADIDLFIRDVCEADQPEFDGEENICVRLGDLRIIAERYITAKGSATAQPPAPRGWVVHCSESDRRTWLLLTSPEGASAVVGCATRRANGSETVQSQVLRYFAESCASCSK